LIVIFAILFVLLSVFWLSKNINQVKTKEPILSRTDYRIFACGEEIFLKNDTESIKAKRNGLFSRSESGSIIADGVPLNTDDMLLSSFIDAAGGILKYTTENKTIFRIPTKTGMREFRSGDLCGDKKADLFVIHHRVETGTDPWSIYSRIAWKYWDYSLTNNYGKVPPGDCFIFLFDSEDVLDRPWPTCFSHDQALKTGELILEK
jgi:hypothetical protein